MNLLVHTRVRMPGPAALGLGHIYQANPSWPWYDYYINYGDI